MSNALLFFAGLLVGVAIVLLVAWIIEIHNMRNPPGWP